jgi:signal transduction histidine kinase
LLLLSAQLVKGSAFTDSLFQSIKNNPADSQANQLIRIATKIQNKDYSHCVVICQRIDSLGIALKKPGIQAEGFLLKGLTSYFAGEYDQILNCFLKASQLFELAQDPSGRARVLNEMGIFYLKQKNDSLAIQSLRESFELASAAKNQGVMATSLNNQGIFFQDAGKHPEAIQFFKRAQEIYKEIGDTIGISYTMDYQSVSMAHMGKLLLAKELQQGAYALRILLKDSNAAAISLISLAEFEMQDQNITACRNYLSQCIDMSTQIKYKDLQAACFKLMSETYRDEKNYAEAYKYQIKYTELNEEIFNEKRSKQINELQTKYETEKRLRQIDQLKQDNERKEQKNRNLLFLLGGSIIAVSLIGFAYHNHVKRKKQMEMDAAIIREKEAGNKAIIEAEEKERIRIARDLHDGVAQTMTAAKMQLEYFNDSNQELYQSSDNLKTIFNLITDAANEVRSVSHSMIPNALLKSGLVAAVRDLVQRTDNARLKMNLIIHGLNERMHENIESVSFRVLQELINNIMKHAQATEVTIQLIREGAEFTIMIEDNGKGFDVQKIKKEGGIGLKNIESRVAYLNGRIDYDSQPGRGTTVTVDIPVES